MQEAVFLRGLEEGVSEEVVFAQRHFGLFL